MRNLFKFPHEAGITKLAFLVQATLRKNHRILKKRNNDDHWNAYVEKDLKSIVGRKAFPGGFLASMSQRYCMNILTGSFDQGIAQRGSNHHHPVRPRSALKIDEDGMQTAR